MRIFTVAKCSILTLGISINIKCYQVTQGSKLASLETVTQHLRINSGWNSLTINLKAEANSEETATLCFDVFLITQQFRLYRHVILPEFIHICSRFSIPSPAQSLLSTYTALIWRKKKILNKNTDLGCVASEIKMLTWLISNLVEAKGALGAGGRCVLPCQQQKDDILWQLQKRLVRYQAGPEGETGLEIASPFLHQQDTKPFLLLQTKMVTFCQGKTPCSLQVFSVT